MEGWREVRNEYRCTMSEKTVGEVTKMRNEAVNYNATVAMDTLKVSYVYNLNKEAPAVTDRYIF